MTEFHLTYPMFINEYAKLALGIELSGNFKLGFVSTSYRMEVVN